MSFGFNFRQTLGYVTDGPDDKFVAIDNSGGNAYPQTDTIGGESIVWGTVATNSTTSNRDRNSSFDPRIAGIWQQNNGNTASILRVDLPSTGDYNITLGVGDTFGKNQYVEVFDDAVSLISFVGQASTANSYYDATKTQYAAASWPASQAPVQVSFATTTCYIAVGAPAGGESGDSSLAHINFEAVTPSGPTITGPDAITEGASAQATGTELDTVTTFTLQTSDLAFSKAQTIDAQTATTLDFVPVSGANDAVPNTPAAGVPLEPTVTAAGITAYQIQMKVE